MPNDYDDEKWVPDDALAALSLEASVNPEESSPERAKRLMTENADVAAAALIHIARNSPSERNRAEASKYILERVLGKAGDTPATGTLDDLFRKLDVMNSQAAAHSQSTISPPSPDEA